MNVKVLDYVARDAKPDDKDKIIDLLQNTFGKHEDWEEYDMTNGYYVLEDGDKIIGVVGIVHDPCYVQDYILRWCCLSILYQHNHLMYEFLKVILPKDKSICAECWRLANKEKAHMDWVLTHLGFKMIVPIVRTFDTRTNCWCGNDGKHTCYERDTGNPYCRCYEDMYVREANLEVE